MAKADLLLETPPASLAAASLYLVSRVWKTLNGFLMTWSGPAMDAERRRGARRAQEVGKESNS